MGKEVRFYLEVFEGPLDLLLHLLSKNKVDIRDIPVAVILEQYLDYIRQMQEFDMDVAAEFITMAAQLMYIKSKMLLPVQQEEQEEDPRAALVETLLEYQQFKQISGVLDSMWSIGRDLFVKQQEVLEKDKTQVVYDCSVEQLTKAINTIFERAETRMPPPISAFAGIVERENVSVSDKLGQLITLFKTRDALDFESLVLGAKSRSEVVALFLAVLELSKDHKILIEDKPERGYTLTLAPPEPQPELAVVGNGN